MKLRAELVHPGDRVEGREVAWVMPVPDRRLVVIACVVPLARGERGTASEIRQYRLGELVDVEPRSRRSSGRAEGRGF